MKVQLERAAFYLTCASAASILFSIAVSQILMALAFAALLFSGMPLRLPPIRLPLALFVIGTVISLLASADPHGGLPQIRKFYVFLILLCVYSTFRTVNQIRGVVLCWAGVAALSAVRSIFQFLQKYQEAQALHQSFYNYYVGERITGFTSHWMTFGGEEMIVMLMLAALLLLGPRTKWSTAGWICGAILLVSVVLGYTRSIFLLGVPLGFVYLLWFWRSRWMVLAVPALAAVALFAVPGMKDRAASIITPHGERDSNMHRIILRRTGVEMIRAHPWLGLGPEGPKYEFDKYVPADVARPLPEGWYGHLHNIYLQYAERGVPTALMLFWLIGKVLYDFAMGLRRKPSGDTRWVLHGAIACILALLAEGYYEYNLGDSEVLTLFLAMVAFGYIALEHSKNDAARA